ncbi:GGDEF domain-containing protein [Oscillospiraceae bacterium LTW-04]|nr:diguanylate cyclase [Oscillospiraceae bacterium MB24-C1]
MKHSALQKFNYILLCLLAASFVIVLMGVVQSGSRLFYSDVSGTQKLLDGWQIVTGGAAPQPVLLSQSYEAADGVTLVTYLDEVGIQQGLVNLVHFKTTPGYMTVRIGDRTIYDCSNTAVGLLAAADIERDHYIPIAADDFGQPLSMTLLPQRGCGTVAVDSALLTTKAGVLMAATLDNLWSICLDFAIMVVGLMMVLAYFVMLRHAHHPAMLWLGMFLGCYSIWNNAYSNVLMALFADQGLCNMLLYVLVGMMGVMWLLFIFFLNKKRHVRIFNFMILLVLLNSVVTLLSSVFLPAATSSNFLLLDITVLLAAFFSLGLLLADYYRYQDIGSHVALGMAGAAGCAIIGLFNTFFGEGFYCNFVFNLGILFFTVCFTVGLVVSGIDTLVLKSRMHTLELAAYRDQLTGCENRRAFDQKLETYRKGDRADALEGLAMAMFDSNNLKIVNDTYGHARGDRLIIDTVDALRHYLGDFGTIYRIGGDEFVVVCDNTDRRALGVALESFDREVNAKGEAGIDVSWGIAYYKPEIDPDPDSVLMRAEHRMYEYKKGCKL